MATPNTANSRVAVYGCNGSNARLLDTMGSIGIKGGVAHVLLADSPQDWLVREGLLSKLRSMLAAALRREREAEPYDLARRLQRVLTQPAAALAAKVVAGAEHNGDASGSEAVMEAVLHPLADMELASFGANGLPWWRQPLSDAASQLLDTGMSHKGSWVSTGGTDILLWAQPTEMSENHPGSLPNSSSSGFLKALTDLDRGTFPGRLWYHAGHYSRLSRYLDHGFNVDERDAGAPRTLSEGLGDLGQSPALRLSAHPFDALVHARRTHSTALNRAGAGQPQCPAVIILAIPDELLESAIDPEHVTLLDLNSFQGCVCASRYINNVVPPCYERDACHALGIDLEPACDRKRRIRDTMRCNCDRVDDSSWALTWSAQRQDRREGWHPSNISPACVPNTNLQSVELDAVAGSVMGHGQGEVAAALGRLQDYAGCHHDGCRKKVQMAVRDQAMLDRLRANHVVGIFASVSR